MITSAPQHPGELKRAGEKTRSSVEVNELEAEVDYNLKKKFKKTKKQKQTSFISIHISYRSYLLLRARLIVKSTKFMLHQYCYAI